MIRACLFLSNNTHNIK